MGLAAGQVATKEIVHTMSGQDWQQDGGAGAGLRRDLLAGCV